MSRTTPARMTAAISKAAVVPETSCIVSGVSWLDSRRFMMM